MNTPKAFANFSPGFEHRENPGTHHIKGVLTLKGFVNIEPFQGLRVLEFMTQGCRWRSNRWAEISERLRRNSN